VFLAKNKLKELHSVALKMHSILCSRSINLSK